MLGTLQRTKRKYNYHRCQYQKLGATLWQKQKDASLNPVGFASIYLSDTEKKYAIKELELLAIELLTDQQALEPLIKRNRTNKTYSARLTRWLDRLAHFDINIKHIAGKHLALTDYLSRNPISKPESIENYDQEYVINCIMPLLEFINNYGSVASQKKLEARTDPNERREQTINQSEQSRPNKSQKRTKQTSAVHHYHIQIKSIQIDSTPYKTFKK